MSFIGATGLDENQEQFDILKDEIDANASYINNLVGIPDPIHLSLFGINPLNPGLFGIVERTEVKIKLLETAEEGLGTDLTGLTTQVEGIQTEVSGIQTEVSGIQTEITGIQGQVLGIEGDISTLNGAVFLEGGAIALVEIQAADALTKANRALDIWDYSGDNVYHKKTGNVGIGNTFGSVLSNKLEVQGNINIPTGSTFRIGDEPFNYTHLAGEQPVSSKWTNATDVDTNIYYNSGNVGIGITTAINNRLELGGNLNISAGSKYKINNVDLAFSDLGGSLSYNSLSDKPTLFDGNYNSLTNQLSGGTNIQILNGVINNTYTYTLPTATTNAIGGVRPDGTTILINNGVISSTGGTAQVNSDWTQTNTSLKSFIQNKPTAGTNISLANNTITNIITGSPTQNIITLNDNYLIVKDKPDSQIVSQVDVPLTSGNEPTITSPAFTETIRTFTHSGGAEAQTTHTITIGQNTICDILIVGGGGGGGARHAGGGGAGAVIYSTNITLTAGTYTIGVGKGGNGAVGGSVAGQGNRGEDSRITFNSTNIYLAKGGGAGSHGISTGNSNKDGGSGGGGEVSGLAVSTNIPSGTYGNSGGIFSGTGAPESYSGGGGGGSGTAGSNGTIVNGYGIAGNGGNGTQISITGTNVYYGGGGGGGSFNGSGNSAGTGGLGGGGAGSKGTATAVSGTAGTGGGGGGGGFLDANNGPGGAGGSGIVIIKLKSTTAIPEGNPITHKTLNFAFNSDNLVAWYRFNGNYLDSSGYGNHLTNVGTVIQSTQVIEGQAVEFDSTDYLEFPTTINPYTIWNGKGITFSCWFRFTVNELWSTLINFQTNVSNNTGIGCWIRSTPIGPTEAMYLRVNSTIFRYGDANTPLIANLNVWRHFVLSVDISGKIDVYIDNVRINGTETATIPNLTYNARYINRSGQVGTWDGQMDDFRIYDRALSAADVSLLYNKTYQQPNNTYTLSVQEGTSIQVNNGTAQYLSGNYTISVGATQSSVLISGFSPANQTDPYPLQNGSTIAIRYSMLQRITSLVNYKKDGLIKYVPASGTNPSTGSWNIIDLDTQPLTQFAGNLPANRLDNIDMSKVATGNLDWSRIASQPALSSLSGNLPLNRTDGNLPANRLDNIDMGKVATGNLHHSRVQDLYLGINNRFWRIEYAYENVITFGGIYINKFRIFTNLHLNSYNEVYNYFQYFLSMSPNNLADRHMYWFGVVKMSNKVGTDPSPLTRSTSILSSDSSLWEIKETNSSQGVWWLNVWVYTTTFCESIICILH